MERTSLLFYFFDLLPPLPTLPRGFQTTTIKTSLGKHLNANSPFPKNVLSDFFLLFASESGALIVH